jgi:ubiquinol-cytochrome c reductase iron-sulfur subunit
MSFRRVPTRRFGCHGSQYDTAGRIRKGPAPRNLDLPPYIFVTDTGVRIG